MKINKTRPQRIKSNQTSMNKIKSMYLWNNVWNSDYTLGEASIWNVSVDILSDVFDITSYHTFSDIVGYKIIDTVTDTRSYSASHTRIGIVAHIYINALIFWYWSLSWCYLLVYLYLWINPPWAAWWDPN